MHSPEAILVRPIVQVLHQALLEQGSGLVFIVPLQLVKALESGWGIARKAFRVVRKTNHAQEGDFRVETHFITAFLDQLLAADTSAAEFFACWLRSHVELGEFDVLLILGLNIRHCDESSSRVHVHVRISSSNNSHVYDVVYRTCTCNVERKASSLIHTWREVLPSA